ncbi:hypothetical protein A9404_11245 [Halothiobacillus diazotrophicus]|uniref:Endonuclease/exonuclease/phosphatase domain-containing protein n=1 Tax=Halothiobacillus diazotrophicus TaxID=1860122 RepID=A0A191ZJ27_9GAMM|nr:endonuclease/exonuclease/phosphatase family protein [Halothiobacillus diazotrophicus]ANJ67875.1 hypothetical protein A9404_11245 [Halothiobacillus diazotrophicus]
MMLRVGTWNIHGCVGRDRLCDPGRTWTMIEAMAVDLLGLQEVEIHQPETDALLRLARDAGYHSHFAPTGHRTPGGGQFGNLLLSRLPLDVQPSLDLSVAGREPRNLLRANVIQAGRPIAIWVTHLGLRAWERRTQVRRIHEHLQTEYHALPKERILLGDFNEWMPGQRNLRLIHRHFMRLPALRSFPAHRPLFPLDAIWLAGDLHLAGIERVRHPLLVSASDHLPIVSQIQGGESFLDPIVTPIATR